MIYYDTETCGLHSFAVLIQWAEDSGPIHLHSVWTEPIIDTLKLIDYFMQNDLCAFNMSFDHFHLCKLYTVFSLVEDVTACPEDIIPLIKELEPKGRDGPCLKPKSALDLMLYARKGPYQALMERRPIKLKAIPGQIAEELRDKLETELEFDEIFFAKKKLAGKKWVIEDIEDKPGFVNLVLRFKASGSLKNLVAYALNKSVLQYKEISIDKVWMPEELGYAPFAKALPDNAQTWDKVIDKHISHWLHNTLARQYASDDITYLRELREHFGNPEPGDVDSELACCVAACRWRGYVIDENSINKLKHEAIKKIKNTPMSANAVKIYLEEVMSPIEKIGFTSTKKTILEELATWKGDDDKPHPVAERAQKVLDARLSKWEYDLFNKLLTAGKFHAAFDVIGARSGRMSGRGGDLNPQGIKHSENIRQCFTLFSGNTVLCGGDFDSFEVVLIDVAYPDNNLHNDLLAGKKLHAIAGIDFYQLTYEEVLSDKELYTRSKSGVFAIFYGGEAYTLKDRLGIEMDKAEQGFQRLMKRYPDAHKHRKELLGSFQSMRQPGGIGTRVEWHDPPEYVESLFGFRRYFTLENKICKFLFNLANKPPEHWRKIKGKVVRRDREQTVSGAVQSALYAAAFALQAANMRAAGNHRIQATGSQITKAVQKSIWDIQPTGIHNFIVQPMNIHDEVVSPTHPNYVDNVRDNVNKTIESFKDRIPLLKMEWKTGLKSWADK